jgi:CheY-like chemotaxis protein
MSRILLVDDSPHAQRMGERILSEEGFEVVTLSNADSALIRMDDVDPDVVLADTVMPGRSGYEICQYLKLSPRHRHVRVVLTAGVLEPLDDDHVKRVQADATLKKPFEASVLLATVKPLAERAVQDRAQFRAAPPGAKIAPSAKAAVAPFVTIVDAEQVRAAVTVALDAAMEKMVEEISARVVTALQSRKPAPQPAPAAAPATPQVSSVLKPAPAPALAPPSKPAAEPKKPADQGLPPARLETVRRVNPLRSRPGSILGLELNYVEPEVPAAAPRSSPADPLFPNARPAADPDPGTRPSVPDKK